ncbi:MAG TPA: aminoglycoside phosphotransferase family protein [Acidisarcina sp.]
MVSVESLNVSQDMILLIVDAVFPKRHIDSMRVLEGGKTNLNILVQIEGYDDTFVLRQYRRGSEVCRKEQAILKALQGKLPVPELIASFSSENECGVPYLIYRYVPGQTFREIREVGSPRDMAEAASAIAGRLSMLAKCDASPLSEDGLLRYAFALSDIDSPLMHERLHGDDWNLLKALYERHGAMLQELSSQQGIRHGDFNHGNVVLQKRTGTWEVAAILDWELAGTGSSLWDVARFTCYEKEDSRLWEDAFFKGVRRSSEKAPSEWRELLHALNIFSAAKSLADPSLQPTFVSDLRKLVHAGLRGKRIG